MTSTEIETKLDEIAAKYFQITYQSINLGNGSEEEQESDILDLSWDGCSDNAGRTVRYHFIDRNGNRYYIFADEILEIN